MYTNTPWNIWNISSGKVPKTEQRWIYVAKLLPAIPANASSLKSLVLDGFPCPPARVGELPFQYSLATDPGMVTAWLHEMA